MDKIQINYGYLTINYKKIVESMGSCESNFQQWIYCSDSINKLTLLSKKCDNVQKISGKGHYLLPNRVGHDASWFGM